MPSLQPIEQRVAQSILEDMDFVLHATADQLAAKVGTSRTSVIRTAQALGYDGYQQLRVALTQEIAQRPRQLPGVDSTYVGRMSAEIASFSNYLHGLTTLLNEKELTTTVESLVGAKRVLIVGNGLSAPLAQTMALRLTSIGRPAEFVGEATGQHIAATQLDSECVCLVVSGSGSTTLTLKAATAAHASGAAIIALTSFTSSPLADLATYTLVIPSPMERSALNSRMPLAWPSCWFWRHSSRWWIPTSMIPRRGARCSLCCNRRWRINYPSTRRPRR